MASFKSTGSYGDSPLAVQFIDTSANSPTAWAWSFGDGGTSALQNPSHTYVSAGTYTVTMTATNSGGSSTSTQLDMITVEITGPVASFTANVTAGEPPFAVQFTDTSTNSPTSWYWSFGDGGTSDEQDPAYEYGDAGTYTVALTATNAAGSNTTTVKKYINVTAIASPVTSFTADATSGTVPLAVQFTDTSTNAPVSWEWTFGDGSSSTLQNPRHTYTSAGSYSVTLTATNAGGAGRQRPVITSLPRPIQRLPPLPRRARPPSRPGPRRSRHLLRSRCDGHAHGIYTGRLHGQPPGHHPHRPRGHRCDRLYPPETPSPRTIPCAQKKTVTRRRSHECFHGHCNGRHASQCRMHTFTTCMPAVHLPVRRTLMR